MKHYKVFTSLLWFFAMFFTNFAASNASLCNVLQLKLQRIQTSDKCIIGQLSYFDTSKNSWKWISYTIEKPWIGNINDISAIPPGRYNAKTRSDSGSSGKKQWRIELENSSQNGSTRTYIQMHHGISVDDSDGCIIVGNKINANTCSVIGGISESDISMSRLQDILIFSESMSCKFPIELTVE